MRRASIIQFVFCLAAIGCIGVIAGGAIAGVVPVPIPGSTAMVTGTYYTPSATDLFDVSQGAVVVSASPTWGNPNGCLGGEGFFEGLNNTLFGDGSPAGAVKTLVFSLPNPISVNTIFLGLSEDGGTKLRGAAGYSLLGLQSLADAGVVLSAGTLAGDYEAAYGDGNITVQDSFPTFTGSIFRLNLTQRTDYYGPRIQELDGFLAPVPEPSTWVMGAAGITCAVWRAWRRRNRYGRPGFAAALLAIVATSFGTGSASAVTIDWVTVGDPGNAADSAVMTDSTSGYGAVSYTFQIAKYETTVEQYVAFLNSNAKSDPYGLYDSRMSGSISRIGTAGTYQYASQAFMSTKPIAWVDWLSAARFANWLNNGQQPGGTETGAYSLNGTSSALDVQRNANAQVWIPSENEWYKAAYYSGASGGYWLYPTQTNQVPDKVTADAAGIGSAGAVGNFANYGRLANTITAVGTNGGPSFYGAFDMGGNVQEWNEMQIFANTNIRGVRGSDFLNSAAYLLSTERQGYFNASSEATNLGFRVAAVPEPSTLILGACGLACAALGGWRHRKAAA